MRFCTLLVILLACTVNLAAQWSSNPAANNPICTEQRNQRLVKAISDGKGGAIFTWEDERSGLNIYDIYAQRIDADGNVRWGLNGVPVCTIVGSQNKPQMCTNEKGGAFIVWKDVRFQNNDIYIQQIDSNGAMMWPSSGVDLVPNVLIDKEQSDPVICVDGQGGCFVGFMDNVAGGNFDNQIMLIRVNADGTLAWPSAGYVSPITPQSGMYQYSPSICSDGDKGCWIAWQWFRGGPSGQYDLYIQRVTAGGGLKFPGAGLPLCNAAGNQGYPYIAYDGLNGVVTAWPDFRISNRQVVYAQRFDANGTGMWTGGPVTTAGGISDNPSIIGMGGGAGVIVWEDYRAGSSSDIYVQYMNPDGSAKWTANGVPVCTAPNSQLVPTVCKADDGGIFVAWEDRRNGNINGDIYAQRFDANGNRLWAENGVAVSTPPNTQSAPVIVTSTQGSAIFAWEDYRSGFSNAHIYAAKLLSDGTFPRSQPAMQLSSKTMDFGVLGVGAKRDRVVAITNTGGDTLHISNITSSSPDFAPRPTVKSLASGTSFNDTIRFTPSVTGPISGFVVVQSDSWTSPDTIRVSGTGTGTAVLDVPARRFSMGYVRMSTQKDTNVVFTNAGLDTLKITSANSSNAAFTISPGISNVAPGRTLTQRIRYAPRAPGNVNARIVLLSNAPSSPDTLFMTGIGVGEVDIIMTPTGVAFGDVAVGARKDTAIDLKNNGTDTLRVTSIDSDDAAFIPIVTMFNVPPQATYKMKVRCSPVRLGAVSGELTIYSNSRTTPDKLTLSANGQINVVFAPSALAFGPIETGKWRDTVIYIQNKMLDTLRVTGVSSNNPAFSARPTVFTIAPGYSYPDTLRFAPTSVGTINGVISYTSNSASTPDKVDVTGEGRNPNGVEGPPASVSGFTLLQNYPNPFSSTTSIPYEIHKAVRVTLRIENILGQTVAVLVDAERTPGRYTASFDAAALSIGSYRFVLRAGQYEAAGLLQVQR